MLPALAAVVTNYAKPAQALGNGWPAKLESVFDRYMGSVPPASPDGEFGSPKEFLKRSTLDAGDYVTITSFSHAPFYEPFILEIPANFSSQRFHNLPLDEFIENVGAALDQGFTLGLDGDFTEPFFGNGVAVLPVDGTTAEQVTGGGFEEKKVTQELRQVEFETFRTTDDHLVHITGKARDQFGRHYYKAKNCWGVIWGREGYVYISEAYLKMKAISITVHKDGLLTSTKTSLKSWN
jgi:bleomycin hydrolase